MKAYEVAAGATGVESLSRTERPIPTLGAHDVLIRVRAASLNYRDHLVVTGRYFFTPVERPTVPLSDGAGEVVSVGPEVSRFRPGDRVAGTFFQVWKDGALTSSPPALGVPLDGTLTEYIALHEDGVVAVPRHLSFEQAATLPCAGVTAWNALMVSGRSVKPGETVLCLGTGGVSMLAMQFAKAAGARVIVTSSSDEKLERALSHGATHALNYRRFPDWDKEVAALTGGRGVDHIVEIGGVGTLARSYRSIGFAGKIALIGFLADPDAEDVANPLPLMPKGASLQGIGVGSTRMFDDMNRSIEVNGLIPIVDRVYDFDHAPDAFRRLASREFVGKIVVTV